MSAILVLAAVLGALVTVTVVAAITIGQAAKKKNETVPGTASIVPDNWFGSHEPEARLHRRVQAALEGIRASVGDDLTLLETTLAAERQALHLAEQLVACSHLAERLKPPVLAQLDASVSKFEDIAGQVVGRTSGISIPALSSELDDLGRQLEILEQARAEVEEIDGSSGMPGTSSG